jgi:hypothetical protein
MSEVEFKRVETNNTRMIIDIFIEDIDISIVSLYEFLDSGFDKEYIIEEMNINNSEYDKAKQYIETNKDTVKIIKEQRDKYNNL